MKKKPIYSFFKRLFDLLFSFILILISIIPIAIICLIIVIDSKGKPIFSQVRVGKNKKLFKILKFRTMYVDSSHDKAKSDVEDHKECVTKFGKFLRKSSLDEYPQIFNIFLGQMSFVGPRPVIPAEDTLVQTRDKYFANLVKPGLTGLAQINGRDLLSENIEEKARIDGEYVKKRSLIFDLKIIFLTIPKVLKHVDIIEN